MPVTEKTRTRLIAWFQKARSFIWSDSDTDIEVYPIRLIAKDESVCQLIRRACPGARAVQTPFGFGFDTRTVDGWLIGHVAQPASPPEAKSEHKAHPHIASAPPPPPPRAPRQRPETIPWTVCDLAAIEGQLTQIKAKEPTRRQKTLELLARHAQRQLPVVTDGHIETVRRLSRRFPNLETCTREIIRTLTLKRRLGHALALPRLLLSGPPGTGKSLFVETLARELSFHYREFSFAQMTGGFLLTGSSDRWAASSPGLFAEAVISSPADKVPLIFGDELDKASPDRQYATDTATLNALDQGTAARLHDEYLGVEIDFRPVSVLVAANNPRTIRPELLSRLTSVPIRLPSDDEMPAVIRSVDRLIRDSNEGYDEVFESLDDRFIESLAAAAPRELFRLLNQAYSTAVEYAPDDDMKIRLLPEHLGEGAARKRAAVREINHLPSARSANSADLLMARAIDHVLLALWRPTAGRMQ